MKRLVLTIAIALTAGACLPAVAQAAFGLDSFDVTFTGQDGATATLAGSHPFAATTSFAANLDGKGGLEGSFKDLVFEQVPGLIGNTIAYPRCTNAAFLEIDEGVSACPLSTQVGIAAASVDEPGHWHTSPVFNLVPRPGALARLGFTILETNFVVDVGLSPDPPYNVIAASRNVSQLIEVLAAKIQLWGNPSSAAHDELRGICGVGDVTLPPGEEFEFEGLGKSCPASSPNPTAFLTLPTWCAEPLTSSFEAFSWEGGMDAGSSVTHDAAGDPQSLADCDSLAFSPSVGAEPTTWATQSPTGLDLSLDVQDEGLTWVSGRSQSRIRQVVVALPDGMTLNPSVDKSLALCSEADLARETLDSAPGEGCPEASRVGTVKVESPLLEESLSGSLFLAGDNGKKSTFPSGLYVVVKNPRLGIVVKQLVEIEVDPEAGRLIAVAEDIPQTAAFSHFELHLREGASSLLVSPPRCGRYEVEAEITPWSGTNPVIAASSFQIVSGPEGGACPPDGALVLEPGLGAGASGVATGATGGPSNTAAPGSGRVRPRRHRCAKGKSRVRRNGRAHCVKKREGKSKKRPRRSR